MELNLSKLKRKHVRNTTWPKEKKLQAVAQYLALGNMKLVEATTGVSHTLLRQWKMQPWWKEFETEIRNTENLKLDNKLTAIVERSLEAVADRLDNGEQVYNQKTGELFRKPVNMKDAARVSVDLLTKRELLRGNATSRSEVQAVPVADQLKLLAAEFARMTSGKPLEIIDVETVEILSGDIDAVHDEWEEGLQEGSGEVYEPTGSNQEEGRTEQSTSGDGESREGS
jgi:hypothetical protein